ncbi:hypothetical protein V8D89_000555 [Ganoderma adspersum]
MLETIASSLRSFGTTSRRRRSPSSSHTSRCEGDVGFPTDSDHRAVVNSYQQILQDSESMAEKRAQEAEERARSAEARLAEAERRHDAERATLAQQAHQAESQLVKAEQHINHLQAALTQSGHELRRANEDLRETAALLDTRTAELRDAQAYLSRPDDVADAEVLHLIEGINSRIFQAAASIADAFRSRYGAQKDLPREAAARVQYLFGDDLTHALCSVDHSDDSLVVQTVLQAVMTFHVRWLCDTWDFNVTGHKHVLQRIYQLIRRTEQQSVAGRWRALSRTYVKTFLKDGVGQGRREVDVLVHDITNILLVCGIAAAPQDLLTEVGSSYADALGEVIHLALEFQRITGEGIISRDLLILVARLGEPFDPSRMDDEWADPKGAHHGNDTHPVLCTTQLGLVREEKIATGGDEEGMIATVALLKPKVVLTSFLEEMQSDMSL